MKNIIIADTAADEASLIRSKAKRETSTMDALQDIKLVGFDHFLAGLAAAQLLGDLGADMITIEPLDGAFQRNWAVAGHFVDGQSVNHLSTGRNKRRPPANMEAILQSEAFSPREDREIVAEAGCSRDGIDAFVAASTVRQAEAA